MKAAYDVTTYPNPSPTGPDWAIRDTNGCEDAVVAFCFTREDAEKVAVALNNLEAQTSKGL